MNKSTTHTRDHSVENGLGKIINLHCIVILEVALQNEGIEKKNDGNLDRIR